MALRLRPDDWSEFSLYGDPVEVMERSREVSDSSYALLIDGRPEAIFGVNRYALEAPDTYAAIWCAGTPQFASERRWIVRNSQAVIQALSHGCAVSGNVVDLRNKTHIRWLRWLGYEFTPSSVEGLLEFVKLHHVPTSSRSRRNRRSANRRTVV